MKPGAAAWVLAALLTSPHPAPLQDSPRGQPPAANAERVESGSVLSADGKLMPYRIRLLPVSSFPDLPAAVAAELDRRGCTIPQSFEAKQPENVIRGAFRAAGSSDWAVLCSYQETSTLYVFFAGQAESPIALRSQADSAWLGAEPGGSVSGSAWGIAVRSATELRFTPAMRRGLTIDHDAIDDARLERALTIHYFQDGRWVSLNRSDGSN
jgi:hypothetical protein